MRFTILKYIILSISVYFMAGCANFRQIRNDVTEVSICEIVKAINEINGKEVLVAGKSKGSFGNKRFILQCLHDSGMSVIVDTSAPDVMPVENSNRFVKVFGKVRVSEDKKIIIIAEATEVGAVISPDEMPKGNSQRGGGGHHH